MDAKIEAYAKQREEEQKLVDRIEDQIKHIESSKYIKNDTDSRKEIEAKFLSDVLKKYSQANSKVDITKLNDKIINEASLNTCWELTIPIFDRHFEEEKSRPARKEIKQVGMMGSPRRNSVFDTKSDSSFRFTDEEFGPSTKTEQIRSAYAILSEGKGFLQLEYDVTGYNKYGKNKTARKKP